MEIIAAEIKTVIKAARRVLLCLHPRADADSVGSNLALRQVLLTWGKEVVLIQGDTPPPSFLADLPGFSEIEEKNYLEISPADFDLFIILDISAPDRISELGEIKFPPPLKTIVIDHHSTTHSASFGQLTLCLPEAAAVGEILFSLFKKWSVAITPEIAICLIAGIYGDTGGYIYSNTSAATFAALAELRALVPDYSHFLEVWREEEFERLMARGLGLAAAEQFGGGQIIVATVSAEQLAARHLPSTALANNPIAATLLKARHCRVVITLLEETAGKIKLSGRSRDERYDVARLMTRFAGGGHQKAAGGKIIGQTLAEAKQKVLAVLRELYPELFIDDLRQKA